MEVVGMVFTIYMEEKGGVPGACGIPTAAGGAQGK